ncbi:ABC transporter ATP-binding protein, partial [Streptococcus suis]
KDIESLCERIFIIDKGKKVNDGSLTVIKERFSTVKNILFSTEKPIEKDLQLEGWEFISKDDFHFEIHYQSKVWTSAQVIEQVLNHYAIEDVTMKELEIENMVRQIY